MLFTNKPGFPPLPFPTALPGLGAYVAQPVTGQHATNPEKLRTNNLRRRGAFPHPRQYRAYWQNAYIPGTPGVMGPMQLNNTIQAMLTAWWKNLLTDPERSAWTTFASAHPTTNYYGQTRYLSGFGMFMHANRSNCIMRTQIPQNPTQPFLLQWQDPPPGWPSLPDAENISFHLSIASPAGRITYGTYWLLKTQTTTYSSNPFRWVSTYLSYPGKILSGAKQGPIALAATLPLSQIYTTPHWSRMYIWVPNTNPGTAISLAWQIWDDVYGGQSPTLWTTLELEPSAP